jgi:hypothetical protein
MQLLQNVAIERGNYTTSFGCGNDSLYRNKQRLILPEKLS